MDGLLREAVQFSGIIVKKRCNDLDFGYDGGYHK